MNYTLYFQAEAKALATLAAFTDRLAEELDEATEGTEGADRRRIMALATISLLTFLLRQMGELCQAAGVERWNEEITARYLTAFEQMFAAPTE